MDKQIRVTPVWRNEVDIDRLVAALLRLLEQMADEEANLATDSISAEPAA
jgi:hypothetical protein